MCILRNYYWLAALERKERLVRTDFTSGLTEGPPLAAAPGCGEPHSTEDRKAEEPGWRDETQSAELGKGVSAGGGCGGVASGQSWRVPGLVPKDNATLPHLTAGE